MAVDSGQSGVESDVIFDILSNRRRRMVLYYLRQHDGAATVNELAEEIAAMENDVAVDALTSQQEKRVYVSLYQTHLPKLDSTGMIDYNTDGGRVRLTGRATEMDEYLTSSSGTSYPWQYHYTVLAAIGTVTVVLGFLNAPFFRTVSVLSVAVGITALFVVSAAIHYWMVRHMRGQLPEELSWQGQ